MARSNSPPHPSMSLPKAIDAVGKIFDADRRNPIDREVAARHIGYTGKNGASDKALAALAHFGLVEKVGKGSLRVSQQAMDILHPDPSDPQGKQRTLLEAGMKPHIYKELRAQFPDQVSEGTLRSYLVRVGFNDAALAAAMSAYLETLRFLEQSKVFESGGIDPAVGGESDLPDDEWTDEMNDITTLERPPAASVTKAAPPVAVAVIAPSALNRIDMDIKGEQVHLNALLDYNGLLALEKKIVALKILLQVHYDPIDIGEDADSDP